MKRVLSDRLAWIVLFVPLATLPSACTVTPGYSDGYEGSANVGLGIDYYEPFGFDYGGWGPGYRTGPPRGGARAFRNGQGPRSYRSAPSSHGMPSIPSGPRGVSRGGGGRGR